MIGQRLKVENDSQAYSIVMQVREENCLVTA